MIYLLLSILSSSVITLIFRWFSNFKITTFVAIVGNYGVCSALGFTWAAVSGETVDLTDPWVPLTTGLGFLFIVIFFFMAKTAQSLGPSVSVTAAKMSLIIPVVYGILLTTETGNVWLWVGVIMAMTSVLLTSLKPRKDRHWGTDLVFPAIVFLGSGVIDIGMDQIDQHTKGLSPLLPVTFIFFVAFCVGLVILLIRFRKFRSHLNARHLVAAIALGTPNFFSIYFLIKALASGVLTTARFFPVNNISIVLCTTLASAWIFRERFSPRNILGIACAIISIIIISFWS